jgi:hypothetical protein
MREIIERTYDLEAFARSYLYGLSSAFAQTLRPDKGLNMARCTLSRIPLVDASNIDLAAFETPQARVHIQEERDSL